MFTYFGIFVVQGLKERSHCHKWPDESRLDKKARRRLLIASFLCLIFMVGELVGKFGAAGFSWVQRWRGKYSWKNRIKDCIRVFYVYCVFIVVASVSRCFNWYITPHQEILYWSTSSPGGYFAHSLAVMSDAAHLLTDFASFMIGLMALHLSSRPSTARFNFGWYRAGDQLVWSEWAFDMFFFIQKWVLWALYSLKCMGIFRVWRYECSTPLYVKNK